MPRKYSPGHSTPYGLAALSVICLALASRVEAQGTVIPPVPGPAPQCKITDVSIQPAETAPSSTIVATWTTDIAGDALAEVYEDCGAVAIREEITWPTTDHKLYVRGLRPDRRYCVSLTTRCGRIFDRYGDVVVRTCPDGFAYHAGRCIDLSSDPLNCGSYSNACPTSANGATSCNAGVCSLTCDAGYVKCGNACVDTSTNPGNCGACSNACIAPPNATPICRTGACDFACAAGYTECGGLCVNTSSDVNNCGRCGNACASTPNATAYCSEAACRLSTPLRVVIPVPTSGNPVCVPLEL